MKELVLASESPRRRELLAGLGVPFSVIPSRIRESKVAGDDPGPLVEELARRKAEAVAAGLQQSQPELLVIGADTIVVLDKTILGKPKDEADAATMLQQLSGRWHRVFTGVAVAEPASGRTLYAHEVTAVKFRSLSSEEIAAYVATKEPLDKAGAYGIQGKGALLVERIDGCYFNVVGLPLARMAGLLACFGIDLLAGERGIGHEVPPDNKRATP